MITMATSSGGEAAKSYFFGGLLRGDSYFDTQDRAGEWIGKAATFLGLTGEVTTQPWCQLCDNTNPATGEQLTLRHAENRRAAFDFTFSPPKGFSYAVLVMDDTRMLQVFRDARREVLAEMEQFACTRVRKDGAQSDRVTANLVGGLFEHYTSRPVKDHLPDLQLHSHAYFFNSTLDIQEGAWKAVEFERISRVLPYFEALFHSKLARGALTCGYEIESKGSFWDISSIPSSLVKHFSKRTKVIEDYIREHGIESGDEKAAVGAKTRRNKETRYTMAELRASWRAESLLVLGPGASIPEPPKARLVAHLSDKELRATLTKVCASAFTYRSTVLEQRLVEKVLRTHWGRVRAEEIRRLLPEHGIMVKEINGRRLATSKAVLAEEKQIVDVVRRGRGQYKPSKAEVEFPKHFTSGQRGAIEYVLRSQDRVMAITGFAGTGKTEMLKSLVPALNGVVRETLKPYLKHGRSPIESFAANHLGDKVVLLAPTVQASRNNLREAGFKNADTVSQFLLNPELQAIAKNGFIVLDEVAQLGTEQGRELFLKAESLNSRVVCLGDYRQTRAPLRGDLIDLMVEHASLTTAWMEQVVRQKGSMLAVANHLKNENPKRAFELLEKEGRVHVEPVGAMREAVGKAYVALELSGGKTTVMVPTHREIGEVTPVIREARRAAKLLGADRKYRKLVRVENEDVTPSEAEFYKRGMIVQFHKGVLGYKGGERAIVIGAKMGTLFLRSAAHGLHPVPLVMQSRWSTFRKETMQIATGDVIRLTASTRVFTRNRKGFKFAGDLAGLEHHRYSYPSKKLDAGTELRIKSIKRNGDLITSKNLIIPKNFRHWEYAYCETVQSVQSRGFERGILWAPEESLGAMNQRVFTTAATRAETGFDMYTDNREELFKAISRKDPNMNAMDLDTHEGDGRDREQEREDADDLASRLAREYAEHRRREDAERVKEDRDR